MRCCRDRWASISKSSTSTLPQAEFTSRSILTGRQLFAQDGLEPSEGNPKFHQQMVYAVAMNTIRHFEAALGRKALWSPHYAADAAEL